MGARGICRRLVDLIDDDDRFHAKLKRFLEYKPCLRHRTFLRVHDQQHRVDGAQYPFHLGTEISVSGRVDDIDLRILKEGGGILRVNGDAALQFDRVGIHAHAFGKCTRLPHDGVSERGLTVVHVGDYCYIPYFHIL